MENTQFKLDIFKELFEEWICEEYLNEVQTDFSRTSMFDAFMAGCRYTKAVQLFIGESNDKATTET